MKSKLYSRIKYLANEGFYLFAISYFKETQQVWIEYATRKILNSKDAKRERFRNITPQEYKNANQLFKQMVNKKE